ncbi:hypothetical protein F5Y19DRAFT_217424 [Xylariaceae sp. FL1651]|nr:hypothetical protein F5Y19DRAFT_217424 [Xylariaceae sp. FL1651]
MAPDRKKDVGDDRQSSIESSPDGSDSKPTSNRSKANIRVSLACVQCRSKHVKCDACQPSCSRCLLEGKPCYYAKSRRGIRDPKKRSLISDKPPRPSPHHINTAFKYPSTTDTIYIQDALPNGWTKSQKPNSTTNADGTLISTFFDNFHLGHPVLPPKKYILKYIELDPNAYHFLLSVIEFCGSLYDKQQPSEDLREAAYSAACGPLPFTAQSVQGLHLLSIVAFGEIKFPYHISFADRALTMAVELGMHRKSFADGTLDPILAESYRRTWWYLKYQNLIRRVTEVEAAVDITDIESDVDLPCSEEWEYQSGDIPPPMSQSQYEKEVDLGRSDFSSMVFQIEISRIQAEMTLSRTPAEEAETDDDERAERIERVDSMICDFLRRVPRWKMDVVDPDGRMDQVLFGALGWAHISRIRLRQSALRRGLNLREYFPLGPACGPNRKGQAVKRFGWNPHPIDIQAANNFCDMFRYPFPIKSLRPMMIPGLLRVAIVYLDACVFLGLDSPAFRARVNTIIQILTIHGETWPLSKKVAEDIQAVANEYLTPRDFSSSRSSTSDSEVWNATVVNTMSSAPLLGSSTVGFNAFPDHNLVPGWLATGPWPDVLETYQY